MIGARRATILVALPWLFACVFLALGLNPFFMVSCASLFGTRWGFLCEKILAIEPLSMYFGFGFAAGLGFPLITSWCLVPCWLLLNSVLCLRFLLGNLGIPWFGYELIWALATWYLAILLSGVFV